MMNNPSVSARQRFSCLSGGLPRCKKLWTFSCFVAFVRVRVYYFDFLVLFVLRHWWVSQVLTPRQSPFWLICFKPGEKWIVNKTHYFTLTQATDKFAVVLHPPEFSNFLKGSWNEAYSYNGACLCNKLPQDIKSLILLGSLNDVLGRYLR